MKMFFGVYLFDKVNEFIIFERMIPGKKYSFLISNMERSDQGMTPWWSIINILPKSIFFFDWYGIEGMKHFVISDDKKSSPKNIKNDTKN